MPTRVFADKHVFAHAALIEIWSSNNRSEDALVKYVLQNINNISLNEDQMRLISKQVKDFVNYIKKHLPKCNRKLERFKTKHSKWLSKSIIIVMDEQYVSPNKIGRPKLNYEDAGPRLKRKLASEVASQNKHATPLLVHAATVSAKKSNDRDMAFVLNKAGSNGNIAEVRNKLFAVNPTPVSADNALAFLIDNRLTKQQYINMKQHTKKQGCDIYPPYSEVVESKLKCRPVGILYSETKVQVTLQNLLHHTTHRILTMQDEVFELLSDATNCKLIFSYGFDGSSGHSLYKQRFQSNHNSGLDNSLFVTTVIPLKVIDELHRVIWLNKTPQSVRFCRPLKIEFVKESTSLILNEKDNLDNQILHLQDYLYTHKTKKKIVKFEGYMTLIDGKVLNILTGTNSCQCCPICGAKPTQLLKTKDFNSKIFSIRTSSLQYGISPLHAWIRFFEFILRVSYRLDFKKWHAKGNDKGQMASRKQLLQEKFWQEMGLNVDKPNANGSGNTNDGNTARRAFSNSIVLSSISGIDYEIIRRFHIILIAISCEYALNSDKFKDFCADTFTMYMEKYFWYPMSPTVHKVLVHGYQIMDCCVLPVGCLGESASEARNKLYKSDRRCHARKCSRLDNITDVFNRAMDSSDPLLSSLCWKERKNRNNKKSLPSEVIGLLQTPSMELIDVAEGGEPSQCSSDEEDDDQDIFELDDIVLEEEYEEN